ncbi:hypothetical protein Btru_006791 [Bulinus truncatus]|nr:hypothetical protein Btru_006791 [Bulinus truncatus]
MAPKNIKDLLCNGEILWDDRLTWTNNSWPQFTECFQNTVLTWIPCGWIWISAPFYAYHLLSIKKKIQRVRVLFLFKMFCILAMIALHITDAFETFKVRKSIASMISPLIWIATMFLHSYLLYLEKTRKKARSPISFVYWILVTLVVLVPLYSNLILKTSTSDAVALPVMCLKFGVALLSVILQIFPDYVNKKDNVGKNPEIFSSFLSWIFLFWFERLVIKGLRTQLSDDDIFNLRPQDKTKCGIDKFLHHWDAEQSRQMSKKAKQKYKLEDNWDTQIPLLSLAATHAHSTASENIYQDATGDQNTNKQDSVFDQNGKESELNHDHLHSESYIDVRKYDQGEILTPQISFLKTLCKCFWLDLLSGQSGMLMLIATSILSPIVLGWLINFTKDPTEYAWHGYIYAAAFILLRLLNSTFVNVSKWFNNRVASKVQCTTIAAIFRKSLIMSNEARKKSTTGEIINLMSIDVNHIESMLIGSFWSWVSAVLLVVGVYLLYTIMGVALLAGLGFMLLLFCMNILSSQKMRKYQEIIMTIKDERMKILNEILNGIKVVKLSGWELMFIKKVLDVRERELKIYFKYCILAGFESFTWHVANIWVL